MIISLALLGFGASGSFLAIFPSWFKRNTQSRFTIISSLFSITILLSFIAVNRIPFDSFRIGIEPLQIAYLAFLYLSLSIPFFLAGLLIGMSLVRFVEKAHLIYFYNLLGSGVGCFLVLSIPLIGKADKIPVVVAYIGLISTFLFSIPGRRYLYIAVLTAILVTAVTILGSPSLEISLSPYKSLPLALKSEKARVINTKENAISRVDIIESPVVKYAPGLSHTFEGSLPPQLGLTIDGENLTGVTVFKTYEELGFIEYLPGTLAYKIYPHLSPLSSPHPSLPHEWGGRKEGALIIEPHGGLDVLSAIYHGVPSVTVVESNPLIVRMIRREVNEPYLNRNVQIVGENARTYVRRTKRKFDLVTVSLSESFGAVMSGAFSLREGHLYTVEAIKDYLNILSPDGILLLTRWLQTPPSESIRLGATIVTALEERGVLNPGEQLVFIRGWMTATFLVKRTPFRACELQIARKFCKDKKFDVVWLPDIHEEEVNIYNCFPEPCHYKTFRGILKKDGRERFLRDYEYDISAVRDNRPFFFHFFKWKQVPGIFANLGRRWLPYGGCGYLVVILLFSIALLSSFLLIIAPLLRRSTRKLCNYHPLLPRPASPAGGRQAGLEGGDRGEGVFMPPPRTKWVFFTYFFSLGIGFLFLEISFMHYFILFLGRPTYAFSVVLAALLVFSSIGSLISGRLKYTSKIEAILLAIVISGLIYGFFLRKFFYLFMGENLPLRFILSLGVLFPISMLMGFPFPVGLKLVKRIEPAILPWVWGINGCASVIASIVAGMVNLSRGYNWVIISGAFFYLIALIAIKTVVTMYKSTCSAVSESQVKGGLSGSCKRDERDSHYIIHFKFFARFSYPP